MKLFSLAALGLISAALVGCSVPDSLQVRTQEDEQETIAANQYGLEVEKVYRDCMEWHQFTLENEGLEEANKHFPCEENKRRMNAKRWFLTD